MTHMKTWLALIAASVIPFPAAARESPQAEAALFPARVLAEHNAVRAAARVQPLQWDAQLGSEAAKYALQMAIGGNFAHSTPQARRSAGENLWMGTRNAFTVKFMVASWASEKALFRPGIFPSVSRTGNLSDVGHYTQMVWPGTQRVGCALATTASTDYLVCRYWPAGNVAGVALSDASAGLAGRN